ncbi:MAG: gamma-glutamylcyclotransferase family protein [Rhodospirillales bacterium]
MNEQATIDVFFYGLFMDAGILSRLGIAANNPRRAHVRDYALVIGDRAALVPRPGNNCFGMVFSLTKANAERLYASDGLENYRPELLIAEFDDRSTGDVLCYNLPDPPSADTFNERYAADLQTVLRDLGFPDDYINAIAG